MNLKYTVLHSLLKYIVSTTLTSFSYANSCPLIHMCRALLAAHEKAQRQESVQDSVKREMGSFSPHQTVPNLQSAVRY